MHEAFAMMREVHWFIIAFAIALMLIGIYL